MHRSVSASAFMLVLAAVLAGSGAAAPAAPAADLARRGFTAEDLVTMKRVSDPQWSPDGRRVAFVLRETDLEADRGRTDVWLVDLDSSGGAAGEPRRLTADEATDSSPRWAPDGSSLYFLSSRSGSSQVWRLPLAGGEAQQVTELPLDVGNFLVSPDGMRLAVTLEVYPECDTVACTAERLEAEEDSPETGQHYESLFVRHWDTWRDGRRSQLFTVALDGETAGEPVHLSRGLDADVPSKPFGGAEEIAFSPDGRWLVFTARDAGREEAWSTDFDLYRVPADGSAAPENLTEANPAWDTQPAFSPDGRTLAYLAMARPGFEADRFRIVLLDWASGIPRILTQDWDRSPGSLAFSPDGATIYATAGSLGQVPLFAVSVADGSVRELVSDGHVRSPSVAAAGGRIVFGRDSLTMPVDLYSVAADGSDLRRLTEVNREALASIAMGEPEQFTFAGWNGETVHAWVVKPAEFQPGRRYPIAFLIHGGPQGSFGNDFHYRWNPQTYAGAGYAAVMIDFHGSTGYGQEFTDSISGDWGGKPLEDLQKGLAAALQRYPWLDGSRACALGASYGGYMINWIAGRWPDGFECLVSHAGVFDLRAMAYETEELWFMEWEFGGPYFEPEAAAAMERWNPVNFVREWRTPMLVIHGERDFRIPYSQSLALFNALQRRDIPSRLLIYPDENHWILKPQNSIQWYREVHAWLDRWLRREGDRQQPSE